MTPGTPKTVVPAAETSPAPIPETMSEPTPTSVSVAPAPGPITININLPAVLAKPADVAREARAATLAAGFLLD